MKSQLDLIVSIVAVVLSLVAVFVFMGTQRKVAQPPAVPKVNTAAIALPKAQVSFTNGLPAGGATGGGGGGVGGGSAGQRGSGGGGGGTGGRSGGPRRGTSAQ